MLFDMPDCGGCRTCELACSFHHKSVFSHEFSSLKILPKEDGKGFTVLIVHEEGDQEMPCDGCRDREVPLCMEVCEKRDELEPMIKAVMDARESRSDRPSREAQEACRA